MGWVGGAGDLTEVYTNERLSVNAFVHGAVAARVSATDERRRHFPVTGARHRSCVTNCVVLRASGIFSAVASPDFRR